MHPTCWRQRLSFNNVDVREKHVSINKYHMWYDHVIMCNIRMWDVYIKGSSKR